MWLLAMFSACLGSTGCCCCCSSSSSMFSPGIVREHNADIHLLGSLGRMYSEQAHKGQTSLSPPGRYPRLKHTSRTGPFTCSCAAQALPQSVVWPDSAPDIAFCGRYGLFGTESKPKTAHRAHIQLCSFTCRGAMQLIL